MDRIAPRVPELLCGPILRRAEPSRVFIWAATRTNERLGAEVYLADSVAASPRVPIGAGVAQTVQLGSNLFIHLIEARPTKGQFLSETLLAYDIVDPNASQTVSLVNDDFGAAASALQGFVLPTFVLQGTRPLRVLHTSCRKLHGPSPDALVGAYQQLLKASRSLDRPQALLLTGDQIYADDVAPELISHLVWQARELMGYDGLDDLDPTMAPGLRLSPNKSRKRFVQDVLHFTSHDCDNHLLTFGEYAAMYLLAWFPVNWPVKMPQSTNENLREYPMAIASVRRLLANVPTYMIFDDHDVTDDWNISPSFSKAVQSSMGRFVVTSALAAYWAFQGWGNDPDKFDKRFVDNIQGWLMPRENKSDRLALFDQCERTLREFSKWAFAVPSSPPIVFFDCRTQRTTSSSQEARSARIKRLNPKRKATGRPEVDPALPDAPPARLMNDTALESHRRLIDGVAGASKVVVLVIPQPVFGPAYIDILQRLATSVEIPEYAGKWRWDLESWATPPENVLQLLDNLLFKLSAINFVILSGDVHYSFSNAIRVTDQGGKSIRLAQFTSSAAKNSGFPRSPFQQGPPTLSWNEEEVVYWWKQKGPPKVAIESQFPNKVLGKELLFKLHGRRPDYEQRIKPVKMSLVKGNWFLEAAQFATRAAGAYPNQSVATRAAGAYFHSLSNLHLAVGSNFGDLKIEGDTVSNQYYMVTSHNEPFTIALKGIRADTVTITAVLETAWNVNSWPV